MAPSSEIDIVNNILKDLDEFIKVLDETGESKGNWKWKCNEYNISTPQKILGDKINELIDEVNKLKENNK